MTERRRPVSSCLRSLPLKRRRHLLSWLTANSRLLAVLAIACFCCLFLLSVMHQFRSLSSVHVELDPLSLHAQIGSRGQQARGISSFYPHPLCIVGNAESAALAQHVSSSYFPSTPAVWMVWGSEHASLSPIASLSPLPSSDSVVYFQPAPNSTWVSAIEAGVALFRDARTAEPECGYFLLLDDDVDFDLLQLQNVTVEAYTLYLLDQYRPALLAPIGFVGLKADVVQAGQGRGEVALTTAFDNAEVIFHSSLLDFLLPFAPRGEGGFSGSWTLPAIHMMLFFPLMYRGHALLATRLHYVNRIGLSAKAVSIDSKLAFHNGSRHAYEYPQNPAYRQFLRLGLKAFQRPLFGIETEVEQIGWDISPPPADPVSQYRDFLPRINRFYDLLHPAILQRPYVQQRHSRDELLSMRMQLSQFRLQLIVFARNRLTSLRRLMKALLLCDYSAAHFPIDLTVEVDYSADQPDVRRYLDGFSWSHGGFHARYSPVERGLRSAILNSWFPTSLDEMAVFLEDDVEPSPAFLHWLLPTVRLYYYGFNGTLRDNPLVGISLYSPIHSQVYERPFIPQTQEAAYLMQLPSSWGALYTPRVWRQFLSWYERYSAFDPLVPGLINVNRWSMRASWKKFMVRFMVETGAYMLYPNLGYNLSFSTNHVEIGENEQSNTFILKLRRDLNVGLLPTFDPGTRLPSFAEMVKYDVYEQQVELPTAESRVPQPHWSQMDQYTAIITSRTRDQYELAEAIDYWQQAPRLREIVVRWLDTAANGPEDCPTIVGHVAVRCRVENVGRSAHGSFLPVSDLKTLTVLSLDTDVRIGYADVEFAFFTAQQHPDQLVGFEGCAAGFYRYASSGQLVYLTSSQSPYAGNRAFAFALTSCAFFHAQYLQAYWNESALLTQARQQVDEHSLGADLLMNLVVALSPFNTKTNVLLVTGAVQRPEVTAAEIRTRNAFLTWMSEQLPAFPFVIAKPFPAKWMKEWQDVPRLPHPVRLPAALGLRRGPVEPDMEGKLTVIMTSYQTNFRPAWVQIAVRAYLSPLYEDLVDRVILVWNNAAEPCPVVIHHANFLVLEQSVNSLNNRWIDTLPHIRTAAVLNLDDDVFVERAGLRCLLEHWQMDPQRLIAPFVRRIFPNGTYVVDNLTGGQDYSVALPRALMLARSQLEIYAVSPPSLLQYVDEQEAHCDDILLNARVINVTNKSPLRILLPEQSLVDHFHNCNRAHREEVGGLTLQKDRAALRSECTLSIAAQFGGWGNPLFKNSGQVGVCRADGGYAGYSKTHPTAEQFLQMISKKPCAVPQSQQQPQRRSSG